MDQRIKHALEAAIAAFDTQGGSNNPSFLTALLAVFECEDAYMEKVDQLDQCFDHFPAYEELREVVFDLLLINFFASDVERLEEDYLESDEWEAIEEQTIDRGTELLNLLLYIRECIDEDLEPDLEDFLKEFLLVDEDEFQDEYRIYEPMIANQILVDSPYSEIQKVAKKMDETADLVELFYPMMSFFAENEPNSEQFKTFIDASNNPAFDAAVYTLIVSYNKNT